MAMGGRVAESSSSGIVNTGAANDLEQATEHRPPDGPRVGHERAHRPDGLGAQQQVFLGEDLMTHSASTPTRPPG